jgi:hypothetical protein
MLTIDDSLRLNDFSQIRIEANESMNSSLTLVETDRKM